MHRSDRQNSCAADVLCCTRLGRHARRNNHNEAVTLPGSVDERLASDLGMLLGMKKGLLSELYPSAATTATKPVEQRLAAACTVGLPIRV